MNTKSRSILSWVCGSVLLAGLGAIAALPPAAPDLGADPRGPIEYPHMTVGADALGVQAPGYSFRNECRKPSSWQARWIWVSRGQPPAVGLFRKEITLDQAPRQVAAWLTADAKYRLYINGRLVSRGPVDIGRDYAGGKTGRWFYDYRDLTPYFKPGHNVIAAEVFRQWPIGFTVSRGQPGFLFEAEVSLPGQQKLTVKSDSTWQAIPAAQFPNATTYEAGREPAGWRCGGFDAAAWPAAREVTDVWEPLVPSEIPPLMEARYPVLRVEGLKDQTVTVDGSFKVVFNRVLSAYPTLKLKGGKGATVTIQAHHQAQMVLGEGEQTFEFPFLTEIAPAFTVEFKHVTSPIHILDVGANFTSQPVEYKGAFECSDEQLNQLWKVARWAVQICLQTHHLDSPNHQEPISDPGDYLIESMVSHYAFAQPWLARQDVRKFAWILKDENYQNFHTSYSLGWLQMLMDYYDYTGDKALVEEMAPYVHELLDTYASWRGTNGLISEAPNYMFMDWVTIGGFGCHHPPAVIGQGYLTAFYYHGLEMAARVATMMGDSARGQKYEKLRQEIAVAFNRELWVAEKGLYRDGKPFQTSVKPYKWLPADKPIETFSPHVNLLAVLYDLAPREQQRAIVDKVLSEKPLNTQPWFMHWVFQAIDYAGLFDRYGAEQMRRWQILEDTQSFREMWNGGDLSHGWCSTPLVQMSSHILGVTPAAPGFKTLSIRPRLCDLKWAKGRVPTPQGDVTVSWSLTNEKLQLDVNVPAGSEAEVVLPVERFEQASVNKDGRPSERAAHVSAGLHHFVLGGKLKPAASCLPDGRRCSIATEGCFNEEQSHSPGSTAAGLHELVTEVFVDWNHLHKWDESNGDTWDPFWADDDDLYSFNDDGQGFGTKGRNLAFNKLTGSSVLGLVGTPINSMDEYGKAGQKERDNATWKACGQECIDSVFYAFVSRHVYGKESQDPEMRQTAFNASLIKSTDHGLTWTRSASENYQRPMWSGPRFGAPYFFHYGKNGGQVTQDQADQYVYALSPNGFWNCGDDYILGRVPRARLADLNAADWSYFAGGNGAGGESWSPEIGLAKPILSLKSKCGMTGPCYVGALKTYLMVVWYNPVVLTKWFEPTKMVYEFYQAPHPWGPWTAIGSFSDKHLAKGHMYGPSLCAKFQEQAGPNVKVWMFTSGCPFENQPTGLYKAWAVPLVLSTNPVPPSTLLNDNDPAVHYMGSWTNVIQPKAFDYQGDSHRADHPGASVGVEFRGTGIEFIGQKSKDFGSLALFLDGEFQQNVNAGLVNFPGLSRVVLFRAQGLSLGRHLLQIINRSEAPVVVDAFRVYGSLPNECPAEAHP